MVDGGFDTEADGFEGGVEDPAMVDLGEVVILGGEPEDGHGGNAAGIEVGGEARGGERFIDGVTRAGEQPDLLSGDDGYGGGLREQIDLRRRAVLFTESGDDSSAAMRGEIDLTRGFGVAFRVLEIVLVETGRAVVVVDEVGE